ncbi:uncharacterized protein [Typha angustifolia]|uniref:uncharacterized protein n=1 Tax=Typha angustifolia TaxID=59011 RepID=UPI003C2DB4D7
MVAKKAMRFSPWWAPPSPPPKAEAEEEEKEKEKEKFKVRVAVTRLEGLPCVEERGGERETRVAAVEVRWKRAARGGALSILHRKGRRDRSVSSVKQVGIDGAVEWAEEEEAGRFEKAVSDSAGVSFSVLYGFQEQGKENKLKKIGTAMLSLAEWATASQAQEKSEDVREKKPKLFHVQRKLVPLTIRKQGWTKDMTLYVNVEFMEVMPSLGEEQSSDDSGTFAPEVFDLEQLLRLADEEEKSVVYRRRSRNCPPSSSSSGRSSPELGSVPKRRFLYWTKRGENNDRVKDDKEIEGTGDDDSSGPGKEEDPIGSWETKEFISRDTETKLKTQIFCASIDQRDESAGGESACTALVAVIANALHSNQLTTPTKPEFDALIREGSSEWRKLCDNISYNSLFPNKHFDLDTILEANIRPISVLHEKSFVGFFQPERFASLSGAMSFDDIWNEISSNAGEGNNQKVYIVSWNDHFFVLKVEDDAYYVMDTLGERLHEGCSKAYILKFDDTTEMYRLPEKKSCKDGMEELICRGKECCREFITRFLAAIPLREELEMEKKGAGNTSAAPHQRLQIEFHFTALRRED